MALVDSNQYGATYEFSVESGDVPSISGLTLRRAELKWDPEVFATATNGEGHVDAVGVSKPAKHMITGTFTGYIAAGTDPNSLAQTFTFEGRFFIRRSFTQPRQKGDFWEITLEAVSYSNVTS